ncbi:hypothetical protein Tco_0619360, partial [Tanacetum coccineum]
MLAKAQEARQILDEEQLAFLADPRILAGQAQTIIPHNATFQTEDLDTYDSDCNDLSTAQAVLMANISNYGSNVISEIPNSETYLNDIDNQTQRIKPTLYDGVVMSNAHVAMPVIDDEETLILEEESRLKILTEDFGKCFSPQQELSACAVDNSTIEPSYTPPVIVDVPSELPKVESSNTSDSNTLVLSSRVKCSTSNYGSKPPGNKRNDKISQTPSRIKKNKIEAQPKKVNKLNRVVKPVCDVDVKHSLSKANSKILCAICNKFMFDGVHDKCLHDLVQNGNKRTKSAKKHIKQNIWKPTGHVFTDVGFKWKPIGRIFTIVCYALAKKTFRIYNRRTRIITETIHVTFDELTAMASEQFSSGPGLQGMTPTTSSTGLGLNPISQQPCLPPIRDDWDRLFQPMFDE